MLTVVVAKINYTDIHTVYVLICNAPCVIHRRQLPLLFWFCQLYRRCRRAYLAWDTCWLANTARHMDLPGTYSTMLCARHGSQRTSVLYTLLVTADGSGWSQTVCQGLPRTVTGVQHAATDLYQHLMRAAATASPSKHDAGLWWTSVADDGPALNQHRIDVSCLLGYCWQIVQWPISTRINIKPLIIGLIYPFQAWIHHCNLNPLQAANYCCNSRLVDLVDKERS